MSRVAKNPVSVPSGVEIKLDAKTISYLALKVNPTLRFRIQYPQNMKTMLLKFRTMNLPRINRLAGTTRSLINNMVIGVSEGFQKTLILWGWIQSQVERN